MSYSIHKKLWTEEAVEGATAAEEWDISVRIYDEMMYEGIIRDGKTKQYFAYALQEDGTQKKLKEWQEK
ncbi:MAG: hypothetical protein IK075_00790 [Prevotella sp.]|nr:hypothetical protein [Prevotella sp.]